MEHKDYYTCKCFFTKNFFVESLKIHVSYRTRDTFLSDNNISKLNELDKETINEIIYGLEKERARRIQLREDYVRRKETIRNKYAPRHTHVYILDKAYLDPKFLQIVDACVKNEAKLPYVEDTTAERVFSLPVFTKTFCRELLEELLHFECSDLPKGRPNTMNNYGILLDELGMNENLLNPLREKYLLPLAARLFPDCGGASLDSHKSFTVAYSTTPGGDEELSYHYDNAEVTLNVCLTEDFKEGSLFFGPMRMEGDIKSFAKVDHRLGYGLLHRGQQMHGATSIEAGERHNLIIWMRSSKVRNQLCPMCDRKPDLVKTVGFGDGFSKPHGGVVDMCNLA